MSTHSDSTQARASSNLRATSMALLERVAMRAGHLGDAALRDELIAQLTSVIAREPYRPLRDFGWESA